jgi:formylglycine-generating enzyme required for sulfatase activity/serine/threonine protein kinase
MSREHLTERLGLDPTASDSEVTTAAKAERGRLSRLAANAQSADAAKVHRDGIAELDAMLQACGLSTEAPAPAASPLSASMLRDLGAASPLPSMGGTGAEGLGSRVVLEPGRVLAQRYEIQQRLGAGGMGAVFAAHDRSKQERIAIKVILPELVSKKEARERFLQEAKVATSLGHPGIVKVFDVQSDGELMFLTMELLEGQTLRQQMEVRRKARQVYSVDEVQRIVRTLGETLSYAHGKTVHRDVKPENVFVSADGRLVLMDFGLAKLLSASALSRSGTAMGTAYYMAPEQLTGASKVDHRADQFAVGVMAYELLTGKVPTGMAQPLKKLRKDVPAGLAAAIENAMAAEAKDRHADMTALVTALGKGGVSLPKVSGPVLLGVLAAGLLAVLGVVFGGDLAAAVKRWQRDPVVAAVDKQRQSLVEQFAQTEQLAKDLDEALSAEVRSRHEQWLAQATTATSAEEDTKARDLLTEAAQALAKHREVLQSKVQGSLSSQGEGLSERRDRLKKMGEQLESAPQAHRAETKRLRDKLSGSSKLEDGSRQGFEAELAKEERSLVVAEGVVASWRAQAPSMLEELATTIASVKNAGSGKGDLASGVQSLRRAKELCDRLGDLGRELPVLEAELVELRHQKSGPRKAAVQGVPPAEALVEGWLRAAVEALQKQDYSSTRRHVDAVAWLLSGAVLEEWRDLRARTEELVKDLGTLPKPKDASDGGPVAWLREHQARVEEQVAAADRAADFTGWQAALGNGQEVASSLRALTALERELDRERAEALGKVPTGVWDGLQADRAAVASALWRRDLAHAKMIDSKIRATKEMRERWLELTRSVILVQGAQDAARQQGIPVAIGVEWQRLASCVEKSGAALGDCESALSDIQNALAKAIYAWAVGQPVSADDRVFQHIARLAKWYLEPDVANDLSAQAAKIELRALKKSECSWIMRAIGLWAASPLSRELDGLDTHVRLAASASTELDGGACSEARFDEIHQQMKRCEEVLDNNYMRFANIALQRCMSSDPRRALDIGEFQSAYLASQLEWKRKAVESGSDMFEVSNALLARAKLASGASNAASERDVDSGGGAHESAILWQKLHADGYEGEHGSSRDRKTGLPIKVKHEATGAVLVLIPEGEFFMGSPESEEERGGDETQHRRVIRKAFYLGETEVTQAQWRKIMGSNPSTFTDSEALPVEGVSWDDCQEFLRKAGGGLRLPSEAEWEYACRAGSATPFSFGASITPQQVNYDGNYPYGGASKGLYRKKTVPAGSLPANAWGLHEMHGNVWEWCEDGGAPYPETGTSQPAPAAGTRVYRGGSWGSKACFCRSADRRSNEPGSKHYGVGLRLAKTLPQ